MINGGAALFTSVYFVRHALSNCNDHNDMTRELTEQGLRDRKLVTDFLSDKNIDVVLSSPYKRSVDTVKEFAYVNKLQIQFIDDFRERRVGNEWIGDFDGFCKKQWEDLDFKLSDGESLNEVQIRNICALNKALEIYRGKNIVIGSHGTALSTVINYYDNLFGYGEFNEIKNLMPWIVGFTFEGNRCLKIRKYNLFENNRIF